MTQARTLYRQFYRILRSDEAKKVMDLRHEFRKPLQATETLESRLETGQGRLGFLKMTTRKTRNSEAGRWVYRKSGDKELNGRPLREGTGRIVSNWDGKNLDPESVKTHRQQLRRAGFMNNTHAKGLF